MKITVDDLQGISKSISWNIANLKMPDIDDKHKIYLTIASLIALRDNIDNGISKIVVPFAYDDKEFKKFDRVRVVATNELDTIGYVGKEGWIINIDDYEYPYEIQFEHEGKPCNWLWKPENLIKVEG